MQVLAELAAKDKERDLEKEQRYFETSTGSAHGGKSYTENVVGRRVMVTQDGANVSMNKRDEQLIVEHGTWRRLQKCPDEELWQRVPKGDYT
jgi:hypothetical protein